MKVPKAVDKILTVILYILSMLPYAAAGILCARSAARLAPEDDTGMELIILGGLFLFVVLSFLIHLIIHEGGHLIFGLATGWKFVSFRIANLVLVKQDGKLKWKKTTVVGTGGQCLMAPPDIEPEKCPFFLYLLGGGLVNIITGGIALAVAFLVDGVAAVLLAIFAIMRIGTGITNLFPGKIGGTMNDGYQIFIELPRNISSKKSLCCLLSAHASLTSAEDTSAIPEKIRDVIMNSDYSDLSDTSTANLFLYKAAILQDEGKYNETKDIYEQVYNNPEVLGIFRKEAACECIYYEIMGDCNAEKIETLADKTQLEYIKATSLYPARKRLMYAYYLIYKNDEEKAKAEYEALQKTSKTHPARAEGCIELKEAERVRKLYESKRSLS